MTLGGSVGGSYRRGGRPGPVNTTFMQFRVEYLDSSARVIHELHVEARSASGAISLVRDLEWPSHAVKMRVLDGGGREVHSVVKAGALRG